MSNIGKSNKGYIYKITNKINNKIYIGKHNRPFFDDKYYGSGKMIKRAVSKYGKENFDIEILAWYNTPDEMTNLERFYISEFKSSDNNVGYNIAQGGEGGDITTGMSDREYTEWIGKLSKSHMGIKHSPEQIKKMSTKFTGKGNPMYGKPGTNTGKKFSDQWKNNISKSLKGVKIGSRSKNIYVIENDGIISMEFKGLNKLSRYCKENKIPRGAWNASLKQGLPLKDVVIGNNQFKKNIDIFCEQNPNFFIKKIPR